MEMVLNHICVIYTGFPLSLPLYIYIYIYIYFPPSICIEYYPTTIKLPPRGVGGRGVQGGGGNWIILDIHISIYIYIYIYKYVYTYVFGKLTGPYCGQISLFREWISTNCAFMKPFRGGFLPETFSWETTQTRPQLSSSLSLYIYVQIVYKT